MSTQLSDQELRRLVQRSIVPGALFSTQFSSYTGCVSGQNTDSIQQGECVESPLTGDNTSWVVLAPPSLPDETNVQGDIYITFPKGAEDLVFFTITDVPKFKIWLSTYQPTSSTGVVNNLCRIYSAKASTTSVDIAQTQIAFSRAGLDVLGMKERIQDEHFDRGSMLLDRDALGDKEAWDEVFVSGMIHGVLITAANSRTVRDKTTELILEDLKDSISSTTIHGQARPGTFRGHEHFGFKDGISQPALRGLVIPRPGQTEVDPGVIVMGYKGDPILDSPDGIQRPAWTKDGSIMVFRKLEQDVPGFNKYINEKGKGWREFLPKDYQDKGIKLTDKQGAALFAAQIVGRWTSGAPLQLAPVYDNPSLANDPTRNNDFDFRVKGQMAPSDLHCPFSCHIRKTAPRNLDPLIKRSFLESSAIVRAGIPYGPEVTHDELNGESPESAKRGLLFVCYQSSLANGFIRQTADCARNDYFPITSLVPIRHGQDPILGSKPPPVSMSLKITGQDGFDIVGTVEMQDTNSKEQDFFVTSRGGEYFFVPSISALKILAR